MAAFSTFSVLVDGPTEVLTGLAPGRYQVLVQNLSPVNMFIGGDSSVGTNHLSLGPGQTMNLEVLAGPDDALWANGSSVPLYLMVNPR